MNLLTLGVLASTRKPDERRLPIHPLHLDRIAPELRQQMMLEEGYGRPGRGARDERESLLIRLGQLQDALLRAWRSIGAFEGRGSIRSWLYTVTTRTCLDLIAGRGRRALPVVLEVLHHIAVTSNRVVVLGDIARAAGGCGEVESFEWAWCEAWLAVAGQDAAEGGARALVGRWDQAVTGFTAVLPRLDTDPVYASARKAMLELGRELGAQPGAVAVLRERGDAFGMGERKTLARVVADPQPERAVGVIVDTAETKTRAQLQEQAQQRAAQAAARRQEQSYRPQLTPRGPRMGM